MNPYPRTRQVMRVVAESAAEGLTERGFALRDAARAAIEQLECELADAMDDVKRLHSEKMDQYEKRIEAEAKLAGSARVERSPNAADHDARELERAKINGPDSRTIDALENALKRVAAAEADFIQVHKNCIAARDRVKELESRPDVELNDPGPLDMDVGPIGGLGRPPMESPPKMEHPRDGDPQHPFELAVIRRACEQLGNTSEEANPGSHVARLALSKFLGESE